MTYNTYTTTPAPDPREIAMRLACQSAPLDATTDHLVDRAEKFLAFLTANQGRKS